jgi:hypothetical protein
MLSACRLIGSARHDLIDGFAEFALGNVSGHHQQLATFAGLTQPAPWSAASSQAVVHGRSVSRKTGSGPLVFAQYLGLALASGWSSKVTPRPQGRVRRSRNAADGQYRRLLRPLVVRELFT